MRGEHRGDQGGPYREVIKQGIEGQARKGSGGRDDGSFGAKWKA